MESLGLSQKDAQSMNKLIRRIKVATGKLRFTWKMAVKTDCVFVVILYAVAIASHYVHRI